MDNPTKTHIRITVWATSDTKLTYASPYDLHHTQNSHTHNHLGYIIDKNHIRITIWDTLYTKITYASPLGLHHTQNARIILNALL